MTDRHFVLHVPGRPRAMPRSRVNPYGRPYQPKAFVEWREATAWVLREAANRVRPGLRLDGDLLLALYLGRDAAKLRLRAAPDGTDRYGLRGDLDNYAKAYMDVAQDAGLIGNDSQIVGLTVGFIGEEPS